MKMILNKSNLKCIFTYFRTLYALILKKNFVYMVLFFLNKHIIFILSDFFDIILTNF